MQTAQPAFHKGLTYIAAIVVVVAAGILIGTSARPDAWYDALQKPWFNPPNWLFAPVWTILYVLIGIAFARVYFRQASGPAMWTWFVQMILNWAWTPLFFGLHLLWVALAVIVALWLSIVAFIVLARKVDTVASNLFIPYLLWVSFATALNASLAVLNT